MHFVVPNAADLVTARCPNGIAPPSVVRGAAPGPLCYSSAFAVASSGSKSPSLTECARGLPIILETRGISIARKQPKEPSS